jgi:hypothetical protein
MWSSGLRMSSGLLDTFENELAFRAKLDSIRLQFRILNDYNSRKSYPHLVNAIYGSLDKLKYLDPHISQIVTFNEEERSVLMGYDNYTALTKLNAIADTTMMRTKRVPNRSESFDDGDGNGDGNGSNKGVPRSYNQGSRGINTTGGIPSEQQILLATADFIAQRFKAEININFIERMQRDMDTTGLSILFPDTRRLLNINSLNSKQSLGVLLRTSLEQDLHNLPDHTIEALGSPKLRLYIGNDPKKIDLAHYLRGLFEIFHDLRKGENPNAVLEAMMQRTAYQDMGLRFNQHLAFVALLSQNTKRDDGNFADLNLFKQPYLAGFFLALLYESYPELFEQIGVTKKILSENIGLYISKISQGVTTFNRINALLERYYGNSSYANRSLSTSEYAAYISNIVDLISVAGTFSNNRQLDSLNERYLGLARRAIETYQSVERKEYGLAINHAIFLFEQFTPTADTAKAAYEKIMKNFCFYGSFATDFLAARNETALTNVISNYAMPVGSSSLKRRSRHNLSLNAYAGGFFGGEYLSDPSLNNPLRASVAFSAPIGLDYSFGMPNKTSWSIFASIIDLGAVVSFRLGDRQTQSLPDLKFENVLAPGISILYGVKNLPLSIGATFQLAPRLRKYTAKDAYIDAAGAYRFGIVALIDIPLFNLYNEPWR